MNDDALQRAKAIFEEETEYYIGFDPGCEGEESVIFLANALKARGFSVTSVHQDEACHVPQSDHYRAIYDWAQEPYLVFHERRPGRLRALYLAVRSSLRELGDAILGKGYFGR